MIAAVYIAAACSQTPPSPSASFEASPSPAPSPSPALPLGGTLHVGMFLTDYEGSQKRDSGKRDTVWDPQGTWAGSPWELFRCCLLRTLMSYNGLEITQGGSILRPDLASGGPQISADGLIWTFHLRPDLRYAPPYADIPIVAADFVRALERELKQNPFAPPAETLGPYGVFYSELVAGASDYTSGKTRNISGLETPDALTLTIHLQRPAGDLATRLALSAVAPIPPGAADGHDAGYGPYLAASGPYMIEGSSRDRPATGYVRGKSLTLVRNPSWQRSSDPLRGAYVDRIEVTNLTGRDADDAGLSLLLAGKLDVVLDGDLSPTDLTKLRSQPALAARLHLTQQATARWITMNIAQPPFDDIHLRRAINYGANKAAMVRAFDPTARVLTHAIPDSMEAGLLLDYDPYATPDHVGSLEKARSEMAQSRYDANHDGVCDAAACHGVVVLIRGDDPAELAIFNLLRSSAASLGLVLKSQRIDDDQRFYDLLEDPNNHVPAGVTDGWTSDYLNGSNWFVPLASRSSLFHGANPSLVGATDAQLKTWGYETSHVPSIEGKIEQCLGRAGLSQSECWAEADQFLMERVVPWVPLLSSQSSRLTSDRVLSFSFDQSTALPALDQIALK